MATRVRVEQRQLLLAVHQVVGVVDVEHDRRRRARVAAAEEIDEAGADPVQRAGVGEVLQPRDRRLARNVVTALRRTLAGDHQRGIVAQRIEVVAILVAGGDRHHARRHHRAIGVDDEQRVARVRQRVRDHGGETEAPSRFAQHHQAAVRGEVAGILRGCERLVPTGDRPGRNGVASAMAAANPVCDAHALLRHQNVTPIQPLRRRPPSRMRSYGE